MSDGAELAQYIVEVATILWGPPRPHPTRTEVRFGESKTVNPQKGSWWVHDEETGGGVLALIERETGRRGRDAVAWLREHGFHVEDRQAHVEPRKPATPAPNRSQAPAEPRPVAEKKEEPKGKRKLAQTWDYVDEFGDLLFQVCRLQFQLPDGTWETGRDGKTLKTYSQRRKALPDDPADKVRGGWFWGNAGCRLVPYRLPEVLEALASERTVFIVEGEKAADRLWEAGIPATTNARGAGKWTEDLAPWFKNADVVLIPDNDPQATKADKITPKFHPDGRPVFVGRDHMDDVGRSLKGVASRVRLLELPGLPPKGDSWDWQEAGGTAEQLYALADAAPLWRDPATKVSRFGRVRWRDLDAPGPEYEFIIDGFLTVGEKSIVAGPSGSGKSFLTIHAGMLIATATLPNFPVMDFFGKPILRPGLVIYQAGEGARGIKKRLRAWRRHFKVPHDIDLPFELLTSRVDLYAPEGDTQALIEEIETIKADYPHLPLVAVFIDTLATAQGGADENSGKDMSVVMSNIDRIQRATGAHVCLVHHMNAGGTKIRGHSSIKANIDSVVLVEKSASGTRKAWLDKQKDEEDGIAINFDLMKLVLGTDHRGREVSSCICLPVGKKEEARQEERRGGEPRVFNPDRRQFAFLKALQSALDRSGIAPPPDVDCGPTIGRVVNYDAVKIAYRDLNPIDEIGADEDARKRHHENLARLLKNARQDMQRFGIIGVSGQWMWLSGKPVRGLFVDRYADPRPEPPGPDDYTDEDDDIF